MLRNFQKIRRSRRWPTKVRAAEIQPLESRTLPAGTVTASFASNVLTLTGDGKGNSVVVAVVQTDTAIEIQLTGQEDTRIKVGSEVHESDETVPFSPTAAFGVVVNLGGGHDSIEVEVAGDLGARSLTKLDVNTGDEHDHVNVTIGSGTTLNFTDIVSIKTGEDSDELFIQLGGTVSIAKTLTIDSGLDSDEVNLTVDEGGALTVTGAVNLNTGDGDDALTFIADGAVTFNGTLGINSGEDSDDVTLNFAAGLSVKGLATINALDGDDEIEFFNVGSTLNFQAGLTVNLGTGDDNLIFNHEFVEADGEEVFFSDFESLEGGTLRAGGSGLTIDGGSGDDLVLISEKLELIGGVKITTGDGRDEISILTGVGSAEVGPVANTIGKLTVDMGDDFDQLEFDVISSTTLSVTGAAVLNTGKGHDFAGIFNFETTVSFAAGLAIDTGSGAGASSGNDEVAIVGGRLNVTGALKIATGGLNDEISIVESLSVTGDLNIASGTGGDFVFVQVKESLTPPADGVAANTLGSMTINTGSGTDEFELYTAEGGSTQVNGIVSITTEGGFDDVWIDTDADLKITKDLKIDTGAADDHVFVEAINGDILIQGSVIANLGDEDDCLIFGQSAALDDFRAPEGDFFGEGDPEATFQVDLNVSIVGGAGDDFIGLDFIQIGKDKPTPTAAFPASVTTIDSGTGDDVIAVDDVILRDAKILAGTGDDIVYANDVTIRGTTNIDLGAGGDELVVTGATSLGDSVTVLGGAGEDDFSIDEDVTLATGKKIKLDGGADDDILANVSTDIDETDLNPAPPTSVEILDGEFDIVDFQEIVQDLFSNCLQNFEFEF